MEYNSEEFNEILNIYKGESEELISGLNDAFLLLEKNPDDKTPLKKILQLTHSLKGASRMIGFNNIQNLAHKLEDVVSFWKRDEIVINADSFQVIYELFDFLESFIDKCVYAQNDIEDENVNIFLDKLDSFISGKFNLEPEENINLKKDINILEKIVDINAIILELIFILDKGNSNSDDNEIISVISENIEELDAIFEETEYESIKTKIAFLNTSVNVKYEKLDFEGIKKQVIDIKNEIYDVCKSSNFSYKNSVVKRTTAKPEKVRVQNSEKKAEPIISKNAIEDFDYVLTELPKIKYDINFINNITEKLNKIVLLSDDNNLKLILNSTINILNMFNAKQSNLDNDCYIVILQCIYLAKRISVNRKDESLYNLNFLMQRLTIVEDMLKANNTSIDIPKKHEIISTEDISEIKNNTEGFSLNEIKTLRIDSSKLDNLITQTGELLVNGIRNKEHINELSKVNSKIVKWHNVSKKINNYLKYLDKKGFFNSEADDTTKAFYKRTQNFFFQNEKLINDLNNDFVELYNMISEDDNKLHQTALEIEVIAKGIRVLPLATIFHSFPRMIRDIAKKNNKDINFVIEGSDTTVDKKIIEEIKMPLIHILRNSISHGIETSEERIKNNKNEVGLVKLTAKQVENNLIITVEDDGYGVNIKKVKEIALKRKLLSDEEILNIDNEQIMKLLFLPGFSTQESIDEISGRGVGLDIVKSKITNLNGDITIDSVLNKGCKVTIKLPLSMSTIKAFIISVNEQQYAIPVNTVKFVKNIKKNDIYQKNGVNCLLFQEHSIPVYSLAEIFEESSSAKDEDNMTVIILENGDEQAAFIADKLIGDQDIFQRKLVTPILKIKNISGFTTLSTGEVCLIINPFELMRNIFENNVYSLGVIPSDLENHN